jgi:hypothetical protein
LETRFGFLSTDEWILGIWTSDEKKFSRKAAKAQRKDESPSGNIAASDSVCLVGRFTALW